MNLYFGIKCVKEEIVQLNVEICRLVTFMIEDHRAYYQAISSNIIVDPVLANALSQQWQHHNCIHSQIAIHLHQTSWLKGFTGILLPGVREGCDSLSDAGGLPPWAEDIFGLVERYGEMHEDEELLREVAADLDLVLQLVKNISIQDEVNMQSRNS
ncbi:hypothetical protein L208DRAFT_1316398 [Tricholoma matsutake]|nr:hypothetical protein L208DRAFT_1316398 [Tricholoma matsutake 945]